MSRRRRGRKGRGRKSGAIPLLAFAPLIPAANAVMWHVSNKDFKGMPAGILSATTGVTLADGYYTFNSSKAMTVIGLAIGGWVGHKVANKMGVNRQLRKLSKFVL